MYVAPLAAGALLSKVGGYGMKALELGGQASMIGGMFQQHQQMKQANEHQEENAKLQRQQIAAENRKAEAIQNLANSNVAGTSAGQAIQYAASDTRILKNQKLFGYSWKDLKGFGKDLGKVAWKHKDQFKDFAKSGAVIAGTGYVADKIIQSDLKKREQQLPLKTYSTSSFLLKTGKTLLKAPGNVIKNNKLSVAIGAMPLIGYTTQRLSEKNMVDGVSTSPDQQEEKSYSAASFAKSAVNIGKRVGNKIANSAKFTYRHPSASLKKTGKSVLNGVSSFMGGGGYSGVKNVGQEVLNVGQKSGNKITQKVGNAIINNPNLAVAASIPVESLISTESTATADSTTVPSTFKI